MDENSNGTIEEIAKTQRSNGDRYLRGLLVVPFASRLTPPS
jgi:hypothetical protein